MRNLFSFIVAIICVTITTSCNNSQPERRNDSYIAMPVKVTPITAQDITNDTIHYNNGCKGYYVIADTVYYAINETDTIGHLLNYQFILDCSSHQDTVMNIPTISF